ncbi:MAG: hypothetical protein WA322_12905 [Pseudolabrys sp.]
MARARCAFRETDVSRAIKAIVAAGQSVAGVRFYRDGFIVIVGKPSDGVDVNVKNPWDEVTDAAN